MIKRKGNKEYKLQLKNWTKLNKTEEEMAANLNEKK